MSGKRVLALYAVILFGFAVVLCRIYFLAQNPAYDARAEAQSTVSLALPTRRGRLRCIKTGSVPRRSCWKPCATFPRLACAASRRQNGMHRCRCASI